MVRYYHLLFICLVINIFSNHIEAQDQNLQRTFRLTARVQSYYEGFQKNTGKNEFTYQSLRDDVTASMLTRCTDGNMAIEWETAVLPEKLDSEGAGFV